MKQKYRIIFSFGDTAENHHRARVIYYHEEDNASDALAKARTYFEKAHPNQPVHQTYLSVYVKNGLAGCGAWRAVVIEKPTEQVDVRKYMVSHLWPTTVTGRLSWGGLLGKSETTFGVPFEPNAVIEASYRGPERGEGPKVIASFKSGDRLGLTRVEEYPTGVSLNKALEYVANRLLATHSLKGKVLPYSAGENDTVRLFKYEPAPKPATREELIALAEYVFANTSNSDCRSKAKALLEREAK